MCWVLFAILLRFGSARHSRRVFCEMVEWLISERHRHAVNDVHQEERDNAGPAASRKEHARRIDRATKHVRDAWKKSEQNADDEGMGETGDGTYLPIHSSEPLPDRGVDDSARTRNREMHGESDEIGGRS